MKDFYAEYKRKLRTPDEAVKLVKSGDWVDYTANVCFPIFWTKLSRSAWTSSTM